MRSKNKDLSISGHKFTFNKKTSSFVENEVINFLKEAQLIHIKSYTQ
jgi:hypothetical protein